MSIKEHISEIFLNKSNSYKFYKDHYNKNNKNNKELKKQNSDLKEEISNKEELITALMYGNKYEEDSLKYCPNCDKISYRLSDYLLTPCRGGSVTLPVILRSKITLPKAIRCGNLRFPTGGSMTRPYSG